MNQKMIEGVIVDAGHGGIDSGAVGNGLEEKNLNLEAATYLYNRLQELGIPTKMTRTQDEYLPKEERIKRILSLYNNNPNTILVSNHINAGGGEGAEVVYSLKNSPTLANLVLENIGEAGQIKRKAYQRRLPENPNKDYYYILRETGATEPILVEYGFIDNGRDADKLRNNLKDYVEGVVKAIADYTGYPYTPKEEIKAQDYYMVQRGDTLYSIARKFNLSIEDLRRINNLTSDILSIGQILYFIEPEDKEEITDKYIVQRGDTLYSIARKFNTTPEELIKKNNLESNILQIGQVILLPKEDIKESIQEEYSLYTVVKGDSLWKIAKTYNIPVTELIEMNNLKDLNLQIGQQLLVPKQEIKDNTYIVQKGDTLWNVANKYNLTIDKLKELNNLNTNLLSIGQELIIKE